MNLMETTIDIMQHFARQYSLGENIDEYWKSVLPEALDIAANETFLALHRSYINEPMKQSAALLAQTVPPRNLKNLNKAQLWLHCIIRKVWLGISTDPKFQAIVDHNHGVIYNTTDPIRWVKPSHIWLPQFDGIIIQIYRSLVEGYKQFYFAQHCWTELINRGRQNGYTKRTFILLHDSHGMRREQNESIDWLRNDSRGIATSIGAAPDVGEDVLQNHLNKLLALPLHLQVQRCGATGKAIKDGVIDIKRQASRYEHVYLNDERHNPDEFLNPNPDESTEDPSERMIANEIPQRLLECQREIEEMLGQGYPETGVRRFKVIQLLAHTPTLTSSEITKRLKAIYPTMKVSESTICRDRQIIEQSEDRIKAVLQG